MAACGDDHEHKIIYSEVPLAQHLILLVMTGGSQVTYNRNLPYCPFIASCKLRLRYKLEITMLLILLKNAFL